MTRKPNILIVEDSDDDYEATVRAYKKAGLDIETIQRCENGTDALNYLYRKGDYVGDTNYIKPDIIMLDLNMPGKDGRTVLSQIKNDPELRTIPVIILTTSDHVSDIDYCYSNGANTYVKKPVDINQFVQALKGLNEYWFNVALLPGDGK
ncbi:MAG: response regulator [Methyloligellaceae bacterium]